MSAFAELDENNVVLRAIVADSIEWVTENLGGTWVETFDDGRRVRLAGIGYTFDPDKGTDGAFIPPKPYDSWVLNEDTFLWDAPIPRPEETDADGNPVQYLWDEDAGDWVAVETPGA